MCNSEQTWVWEQIRVGWHESGRSLADGGHSPGTAKVKNPPTPLHLHSDTTPKKNEFPWKLLDQRPPAFPKISTNNYGETEQRDPPSPWMSPAFGSRCELPRNERPHYVAMSVGLSTDVKNGTTLLWGAVPLVLLFDFFWLEAKCEVLEQRAISAETVKTDRAESEKGTQEKGMTAPLIASFAI